MPSSAAIDMYMKMSQWPASELAQSKLYISKKLGYSESKLYKLLGELIGIGCVSLLAATAGRTSTVKLLNSPLCRPEQHTEETHQTTAFSHGSIRKNDASRNHRTPMSRQNHVNPKNAHEFSEKLTEKLTSKNDIESQENSHPEHVSEQPAENVPCISLKSFTSVNTRVQKHFATLRVSASAAAETAAARACSTDTSETEPARQFPVAGKLSPYQINIRSRRAELAPDDVHFLWGKRRSPTWHKWFGAMITGTAEAIKAEWMVRHEQGVHDGQLNPRLALASEKSSDSQQINSRWRAAAKNMIETGVTVQRFLDAAMDLKMRSMKYPTLPFLASEGFKLSVNSWTPKEEREFKIDGEDTGVILERSADVIEKSRGSGVTPSMMIRGMPLRGNWPGLWGNEDNTRGDEWIGTDLGGSLTRDEGHDV